MNPRDAAGPEIEDVISVHHGLNTSTRPWQLTVQLPRPIQNVRGKVIALAELVMVNALFNVTAALGNQQWSYCWIDGTVVTDTIPDGRYNVVDGSLQAYIQSRMFANGHFLAPSSASSGLPLMFFVAIVQLPTFYKYGLQVLAVPSSMPSGYSLPTGTYASPAWTLPPTRVTPQVTLPAPATPQQAYLGQVLGILPATYPPTPLAINYQHNSDFAPMPSPVSCIQVTSDTVENCTNANNNLVYSFSTSLAPYLSTFHIEPSNLRWIPLRSFDALTSLTLSFLDGLGNPLAITDPSYNLTLLVKDGRGIF